MKPLIYSLKVWQTSVVLSPLLVGIFFGRAYYVNPPQFLFMIFSGAVAGLIFSVPSFLMFWVSTCLVVDNNLKQLPAKILLSAAGVCLTLIAFILLNIIASGMAIYFAPVYALVIVAGIWFYKLKTQQVNATLQK